MEPGANTGPVPPRCDGCCVLRREPAFLYKWAFSRRCCGECRVFLEDLVRGWPGTHPGLSRQRLQAFLQTYGSAHFSEADPVMCTCMACRVSRVLRTEYNHMHAYDFGRFRADLWAELVQSLDAAAAGAADARDRFPSALMLAFQTLADDPAWTALLEEVPWLLSSCATPSRADLDALQAALRAHQPTGPLPEVMMTSTADEEEEGEEVDDDDDEEEEEEEEEHDDDRQGHPARLPQLTQTPEPTTPVRVPATLPAVTPAQLHRFALQQASALVYALLDFTLLPGEGFEARFEALLCSLRHSELERMAALLDFVAQMYTSYVTLSQDGDEYNFCLCLEITVERVTCNPAMLIETIRKTCIGSHLGLADCDLAGDNVGFPAFEGLVPAPDGTATLRFLCRLGHDVSPQEISAKFSGLCQESVTRWFAGVPVTHLDLKLVDNQK